MNNGFCSEEISIRRLDGSVSIDVPDSLVAGSVERSGRYSEEVARGLIVAVHSGATGEEQAVAVMERRLDIRRRVRVGAEITGNFREYLNGSGHWQ